MIGAGVGAAQIWMVELAHAATGGLIAAVWQGMLLSLLVASGLRLLPKTPAAVRFAIWFGVFLAVAALPSVGLWQRGGSAVAGDGHAAWVTLDERWCLIVAAVWGVASLVRAVTLLLAVLRVRTLWKRATPLEFEGADFAKICAQAGSRHAELCASEEVDRPTVIGFFSPKILIPAWLVEKLSADELEQIVLHEAGHLSRADDWMNLLQKIALVVFPLNPALDWVERRLCFERELACDEHVLKTTGAPKAYAACLASLAEHRLGRRGLALALGALGRESEIGHRVRRILSRSEWMRPAQARLVLVGAMLGLLASVAGLERCPQLVGFAPMMDRPTVASETIRRGAGGRDGYGYEAVVFHPQDFHAPVTHSHSTLMRRLRPTANTDRETKLIGQSMQLTSALNRDENRLLKAKAAERTEDRTLARADEVTSASGASGGQRASDREVAGSDGMVVKSQSQNVTMHGDVRSVEWVVVTSWRGEDDSRMVLTTVRTISTEGVEPEGLGATSVTAMQDQVYPYAAVPVRDGWLVFEL